MTESYSKNSVLFRLLCGYNTTQESEQKLFNPQATKNVFLFLGGITLYLSAKNLYQKMMDSLKPKTQTMQYCVLKLMYVQDVNSCHSTVNLTFRHRASSI